MGLAGAAGYGAVDERGRDTHFAGDFADGAAGGVEGEDAADDLGLFADGGGVEELVLDAEAVDDMEHEVGVVGAEVEADGVILVVEEAGAAGLELAQVVGGEVFDVFAVAAVLAVGVEHLAQGEDGVEGEGELARAGEVADRERGVGAVVAGVGEHEDGHAPLLADVAEALEHLLRPAGEFGGRDVGDVVDDDNGRFTDEDFALDALELALDAAAGGHVGAPLDAEVGHVGISGNLLAAEDGAPEEVGVAVLEVDIEDFAACGGDVVGYLVGEDGLADVGVAEEACEFALEPEAVPEGPGGGDALVVVFAELGLEDGLLLHALDFVFVFVAGGFCAVGDGAGCVASAAGDFLLAGDFELELGCGHGFTFLCAKIRDGERNDKSKKVGAFLWLSSEDGGGFFLCLLGSPTLTRRAQGLFVGGRRMGIFLFLNMLRCTD